MSKPVDSATPTEQPGRNIDSLPPAQRRDYIAVEIVGLSLSEQADKLGINRTSVSENYSKASAALQDGHTQSLDRLRRAADLSTEHHIGPPKRMRSLCLSCGAETREGYVDDWLDTTPTPEAPRQDVSTLCLSCNTVADHRIEILERWPGVTRDK